MWKYQQLPYTKVILTVEILNKLPSTDLSTSLDQAFANADISSCTQKHMSASE